MERRAKMLRLRLSNAHSLVIHLKMSGQLLFVSTQGQRIVGGHPTADWVMELPSKHTRIIMAFQSGDTLFFNDQRMFGWIKMLSDVECDLVWQALPPDIHAPNLSFKEFHQRITRRNAPIKQIVMDSEIISGVGNIYANDGLHLAGIFPWKRPAELTMEQLERLFVALREVIELGIALGGAKIADFVHADGMGGQYQTRMRVYHREGQPCLACKEPIKRGKMGGRSTFWCVRCQPE
jgi:formamidopyrimidine-DNA glycosylase